VGDSSLPLVHRDVTIKRNNGFMGKVSPRTNSLLPHEYWPCELCCNAKLLHYAVILARLATDCLFYDGSHFVIIILVPTSIKAKGQRSIDWRKVVQSSGPSNWADSS